MNSITRRVLAAVLTGWLGLSMPSVPAVAAGRQQSSIPADSADRVPEAAILHIRVLEGEGAVFAAGSKTNRGLLVQVTDEVGRPVPGVAVSFRLPDEGPTGVFASSLRTDIVVTGADGRAGVYGMKWSASPGQVFVRVTASKGQARAGAIVPIYLSDAPAVPEPGDRFRSSGNSRRWLKIGLIVAGVGVGGALFGSARGGGSSGPLPPAAVTPPTQIGFPDIIIGRPQ
ncbi:MAG: hypothetical protein ACK5AZ_02185 [Bryobacteraceae bacterium]